MNLIAVRTAEAKDLPWPRNSIYKYSSENRFPTVIIKIEGKLYVDLDAFDELAGKSRDEQVAKAKAARRGLEVA